MSRPSPGAHSRRRRRVLSLAAIAAVTAAFAPAAMGAVTFGGAETRTADTSGSITVPPPAGASTANGGSLLLVQLSASDTTIDAPAGWTLVASGDLNDVRQAVYQRRYSAATASYTFTTSGTANRPLVGTLVAYNGIDGTDPLDTAALTTATGTGTSVLSNVVAGSSPTNAPGGSRLVGFGTIDGSPSLPTVSLTAPFGAQTRGAGDATGNASRKIVGRLADVAIGSVPNLQAFGWTSSDSRHWAALEVVVRSGNSGSIASAPGAPTGVGGTAGDAQVSVGWTAPGSDGGAAITGYEVTAAPGGATCSTTGALSCTVTGLTNGQAYTFTVTATNDAGTSGASSPSAAVTPQASPSPGSVPGKPRNVSVTPGDASGTVSWQRPSGAGGSSITGYTATATPGGRTCEATGLSCTISGLTNGTAYTVTVRARNASGEGPASDPSAAFTPTARGSSAAGRKNAENNRPRPRVTLCHATKSATNPYVVITVDPNSIITQGHDQHQDGRDIIPAFTYEENGTVVSYPGKNLTPEGLALLANGCKPSAQTSVAAALIDASKPGPKKTRVTLCHATRSATNPYVRITVAPEAVYKEGHDQHQDGRDIIPPFSYDEGGATLQYPGKNWDSASQAIFSNGCKPLKPETGPASLSATVTFCAALGGGQYVRTTATVQEVLQRGGGNGDIIPPFTYSDGGTRSFAGLNWNTTARSILDAGCVAPIPTTPASPVEPVVTCINVNDDGSFSAVFGYLNPNAVAVIQPVGAGNAIALGAGAEGAAIGAVPTRFMPGSLDVAVTVSGIGEDGSVTWTIAAPGEARTATATGASPRCTAPATTPEVSVRAECVIDQGNGSYAARFGYQSDETSNVSVPLGPLNTLTQSSGGPVGQVQTTTFQPGLTGSAFTVSGIGSRASVTWRVVTGATTRTATASLSTLPSCFAPAPPPPGSEPTPGGPTSGGDVPPYQVPNPGPGGNVTCEQLGYANSSGRINYSDAGFTQSFSRQGITVSVSSGTYVTWSTAFPVGAVIVKGGPRANVYQYSPGRYGDTGLASPVNASGNPAGLSNLTVCWNPGAPGPDPSAPTTNPESTPTEPIGVAVSCVKKNTDGTYDAVFSYTNPNMMSVDIPGGAANYVAEGPTDPESQLRGQPTSFLPGSTPVAFVVAGIPAAKTITWTVAYYGTRQATADVNYPSACVLTRINSLPVVDPNPPSTPTPPVDPTDPNSPVPGPPAVTPPSPRTVQLGVYLQCVDVRSRTYSATFGYVNPNGTALPIAVGPANRMVGARSYDRGQPGVFAPGSNAAAFTVTSIPRASRPSWQVTLPSGQVVSATATPSAPRCSATSRPSGPGITTTITTPRRVPTRSRVRSTVKVSNPGTTPLYDVDVTIPTPRNLSRPMKVTPPPGARCAVTGSRTVCTFSSLMPGTTRSIALLSRASVPGTRMPLSRAAGLSGSGSALTAVSSTPLTVFARGTQPVTG